MKLTKSVDDLRPSGLAEEYEMMRHQEQVQEIEGVKTSFLINVSTLGLINSIADFYDQSKKDVYNDLLQHATEQFFISLPAATRRSLAKAADAFINNEMKAAYKAAGGSHERVGLGHWEGLSLALDKSSERSEGIHND